MNTITVYEAVILEPQDNKETTRIFSMQLNPEAPLFKGHFPGQPVLPGVVMVGAVKKAMEALTQHALMLETSSAIKFLDAIIPGKQEDLRLIINYMQNENGYQTDAQILAGDKAVFKLKGTYKSI